MNKIMCPILLLFPSIITISSSNDDKTSFLTKISSFPSNRDYSIHCVLKNGTTQLFGRCVISVSLYTILFVPIHPVVNNYCAQSL